MQALGPDFYLWAICLLFGAFCVLMACLIILRLGFAASASAGNTLELHIGEWLRIATTSPAVAFFLLGIIGGVGLPGFYSYLYRPDGPNGYDTVTVYGTFASTEPKICFQGDAVTHSDTAYTIRLPRRTSSVNFAIEPANMLAATNLMIELDGDAARYSFDNQPPKAVAIDRLGVARIPDPLPVSASQTPNTLIRQLVSGSQVMSLKQALRGEKP